MSNRPDWSNWILEKNAAAEVEELKKSGVAAAAGGGDNRRRKKPPMADHSLAEGLKNNTRNPYGPNMDRVKNAETHANFNIEREKRLTAKQPRDVTNSVKALPEPKKFWKKEDSEEVLKTSANGQWSLEKQEWPKGNNFTRMPGENKGEFTRTLMNADDYINLHSRGHSVVSAKHAGVSDLRSKGKDHLSDKLTDEKGVSKLGKEVRRKPVTPNYNMDKFRNESAKRSKKIVNKDIKELKDSPKPNLTKNEDN